LDSSAGPRSALTLWLMANCKRESKLSATVNDPIHGKEFPTAQYFFRCSGTRYGLEALARSLQDGDNVIALAALESLREVASGNDILGVGGDHQPIVDALNHRRQLIRLYAALALGWSAPKDVYPGMDGVVPLLGQALLGARPASVVLMVPDAQKRTALAAQAKGLGLEVKAADGFEAAIKLLDKSAEDVELVIIDYALSAPSADQAVARVREHPLLRAVPVVVLASKEKLPDATTVLAKQAGVAVLPDGVGADVVAAKVAYLRQQMGRVALTKNDNTRNALLAAVALERLAWLNLKTYNVQQAGDSLVKSVYGSDWTLAAQCAKVLALLSAEPAQQSLAQAGIDRKDMDQKVYLLNLLADSVRRSGNRLTAKQIGQLQTLAVEEANPAVRQATGNVLGAMNLEPQVARKVILAREPFGAVK